MNDYTGRLLHEAKMQDLTREASGGWRMRAHPGRKPRGARLTSLTIRVMGAAVAAVLASVKFISG
jgi:hypothetical protein